VTQNISVNKIATFTGHSGSVYALEHFGDGLWVSGGGDGIVASWNLFSPDEGEVVTRTPGVIYSLLKMDETLLVGSATGAIHVVNIRERKEERLLQYHNSGIFILHHIQYHHLILSLSGDGKLGVIDANSLALKNMLSLGTTKLRGASVHPNQNLLAIGSGDGSINTFSLPELNPLHHWQAHQPGFSVNAIRFSPDGKFLLSGSRDAHLHIFDVENEFKLFKSIPAHNYAIYSIEYSPDEKLFATASRDKTIKIWDAETFEVLYRIDKEKNEGHLNSVNKLLWMHTANSESPDPLQGSEQRLISASDDRKLMVWSIR